MKWLALMLASLFPLSGIAAEPVKGVQIPSAIDLTLPIHQKQKLHPELSDPVLGDQAQIVEWAWNPQYAKRFNQPVQPDGLNDGGLWLIGVKVQRVQSDKWQRYRCSIIGLIDNNLAMITPPGEQYMMSPDYIWFGGLPGMRGVSGKIEHTPGQAAWIKRPRNKKEEIRPEWGIGIPYRSFYRHFQPDLAFFELDGSCGIFKGTATHRNEISFPVSRDNKTADDHLQPAQWKSSAIRFEIPEGLMQRIYPYIQDADDWSQCFMRRVGGQSYLLTDHALKTKRFGNTCESAVATQKNH